MSSNLTNMTVEQKIDKILLILEGTDHNAGLLEKVEKHDDLINGKDGGMGILGKVNFMWRIHVWAIGVVGMCIGAVLTSILKH